MSMKRKEIGTVLMSVGGFIMLIEVVGMLTGTLGGPEILYFLGGLLDGLGLVFVLGGLAISDEYRKKWEMM